MITPKPNLVVIGAGIIGITIAREAALSQLFEEILIEKERQAGFHASSRNSGVIHSGFIIPDSKANFCSEGNRLMRDYILTNSLSFNPCGKVVVSKNEADDKIIEILGNRAKQNNCLVKVLNSSQIDKYEPAAKTNQLFLWSPNTWSASPIEILNCLLKEIKEYGVKILLGEKVVEVKEKLIILEDGKKINYDYLVNASGGYHFLWLFVIQTKYKILHFK